MRVSRGAEFLGLVIFVLVGASARVLALSNNTVLGSDALNVPVGLSIFNCPGAVGINYTGGGSALGERALVTDGTQTVSPMSRFLGSGACSAADATKAEGIAYAADGLSILLSGAHQSVCENGPGPIVKDEARKTICGASGPKGFRSSGNLAGYLLGANSSVTQVTGWRDVLRLLWLGLPNTAGKDPDGSTTAGRSLRDCNSSVRQALVNNWGNLFENNCSGSGGGCTQLNHSFRPDSFSGAADILRELIYAKAYPFCNQRFAGDTNTVEYPTTLSNGTPIFEDTYQDFDPIRRPCVGGLTGQGAFLPAPTNGGTVQPDFPATAAEQVCGPRGTLGLVLPIRPPSGLDVQSQYPMKPCLRGAFNFGPAPKLPGSATKDTLCPNGDVPLGNTKTDYNSITGIVVNSTGICLIPAAADGDSQCINGRNNLPPVFDAPGMVALDGRIYNLHGYSAGTTPTYLTDAQLRIPANGAAHHLVGAFNRIHSTRTLVAAHPTCLSATSDGRCCAQRNATTQLGCLAAVDKCSLGLAASAAAQFYLEYPDTSLLQAYPSSINNVVNGGDCVAFGSYPLSHKVYLNTAVGFANVTGQELELTKCMAGSAPNFNAALLSLGLVPLPGGPVCEDFAQQTCPGGAPASNACASNPSGVPALNLCVGVPVDDGKPCTKDSCDPATGVVSHVSSVGYACGPRSCSGTQFTDFPLCDASGHCIASLPTSCGDYACDGSKCGQSCSSDSQCGANRFCDVQSQVCIINQCPSGPLGADRCRTYACDPVTGQISSTPMTPEMLDDHNPCTTDTCSPTSGPTHVALVPGSACDDEHVCNGHETCNTNAQCIASAPATNGTSCSLGNLCFADTCQSGSCSAGSAVVIADSDGCTLDICTPAYGVKHHMCNALDRTISTVLPDAAAFLYTGSDPVQTDGSPFLVDPTRVAVVRGRVYNRSSAPLPGVKVSVVDNPYWGSTMTQGNGEFDLVVNGGEAVRLRFELDPYLPVERNVLAPVQDYAFAADVAMTLPDSEITPVDLSGSQSDYQVAYGSYNTDSSGVRRATLFVPPGVQGNMTLPDSSSQALPSMHFRATEYSVGTVGPKALPATLPDGVAYSYAVSLAADEARAARASRLEFSQPLSLYVDNFLSFKVGTKVPFAFHDSGTGAWVPSSNGVVLRILSINGGQATVDYTGDGQADSGSSIGLGLAELRKLATEYGSDKELWRVQLGHFTDEAVGLPASAKTECRPVRCLKQGVEVPCTYTAPAFTCDPSGFGCTGACGPGVTPVGGACPGEPYYLRCCKDGYHAAGCGKGGPGLCIFNGLDPTEKPACDYPSPPVRPDGNGPGDCKQPHSSTIQCQRQSLGEDIAIAGTPYALH